MYGNPVQDLASKEKPTDVSIFFIPDYIEQVFREKKISLSDFDQAMYNLHAAYEENKGKLPTSFVTRMEGGEVEEGEEGLDVIQKSELIAKIFKTLSKLDIRDMYNLNKLASSFLIEGKVWYGGASDIDIAPIYNMFNVGSFIRFNNDDSRNTYQYVTTTYLDNALTDDVIMNGHKVYSIVPTDKTMFVIVRSGFGNVITNSSPNLRSYFLKSIVADAFKTFGLDTIKSTPLFRAYLRYAFQGKSGTK